MRLRAIIMLVLALVLGVTAAVLVRGWLAVQLAAVRTTVQPAKIEVASIVVAASPLRFGETIDRSRIRVVDWPSAALPAGAFTKVDDLLGPQPRMVLQSIEQNEPILASKITGPGARATLSAIIEPDMRAMTVRVDDVVGVAGFVLPGDRVDVLLTRQIKKDGPPVTDVLLQNITVLGVDQQADQKADKPIVVRAATLEVTTEEAQKLILATQVGGLTLVLRGMATLKVEKSKRVGIADLDVGQANDAPPAAPASAPPPPAPVSFVPAPPPLAVIGITRGLVREEYQVAPNGRVLLPGMSGPPPAEPPPAAPAPSGARPAATQPGGAAAASPPASS
ncbi:MAG: Flp pilus assembly protein CpaB [Dongiaceae bacterium]